MNIPINVNLNTNQRKNIMLGTNPNRNTSVEELREGIVEDFQYDLYYKSVFKNLDETITFDVQIYDGKSGEKKIKKFRSYPYPTVQFKSGDYISYTDDSNHYQIWLIINLDQTNEFEVTGEIQQCVYELPWQNQSREVIKRWCVIEEASSGDALQITDQLRVGESLYKIKLPFDSETKLLRADKRLMIDIEGIDIPDVYKITKNNKITQNYGENGNVVVLTVKFDKFDSAKDNKDLMIADYYSPTAPDNPGTANYSVITCSNSSNQLSIGFTRTLSVVFYDNETTVNNSITAHWYYTVPSGVTIAPISGTNNLSIKVANNDDLVGTNLTFTVDNGSGGYSSDITLTVVY